jgi:hypothetical protein
MITNDEQLEVTLERITRFESIVVNLRKTEKNPESYRASASGFLAENERMQRDAREFRQLHPSELTPAR